MVIIPIRLGILRYMDSSYARVVWKVLSITQMPGAVGQTVIVFQRGFQRRRQSNSNPRPLQVYLEAPAAAPASREFVVNNHSQLGCVRRCSVIPPRCPLCELKSEKRSQVRANAMHVLDDRRHSSERKACSYMLPPSQDVSTESM